MHRSHHRWHSPALGRDMELLVFGHHGAPVIVFPTSMGRYFDWEDRGLVAALSEHLEQGWLQLVCVDSVDAESWYCGWAHPSGRVRRHLQYERYVLDEVVPGLRLHNDNPFWMTAGCSFGAYHAIAFGLRHPHLVRRSIGLSGIYDVKGFLDGHYDDEVYFVNPVDFTANLHDPGQIAVLQRQDIILVTGRDDVNRPSNELLSANLWRAGVGNALRVWDGWAHDWGYWKDMLRLYVGGHD